MISRSRQFDIFRAITAALIASLIAIILIIFISKNPLETIRIFFYGPFMSKRYFGNMLEAMVPILFSGIAFSILFQASQFNLAVEGVYMVAGLLGSLIGIYAVFPAGIHPVICLVAGGISGMIILIIPAVLKVCLKLNELLISLMMNNIAAGIILYLLAGPFKDQTQSPPITRPFVSTAKLPIIFPGTRIHLGFPIAILISVAVYFLLYKTKLGYEIRMTGHNEKFAVYSGINTKKVIIISSLIAGLIAGVGATAENIGLHTRFEWSQLPGYGFDGAMIAILGFNNPLGILLSSLFVAYLRTGASLTSRIADIPLELKDVLIGIIFLLVSAEQLMRKLRQWWVLKGHSK
jgi:simple sugar transport system permease protein